MPVSNSSNRLLSRFSPADFALLDRHLVRVDLPLRRKLERAGRPIEHVYFPEAGSLRLQPPAKVDPT
jgi:hypothetical protein